MPLILTDTITNEKHNRIQKFSANPNPECHVFVTSGFFRAKNFKTYLVISAIDMCPLKKHLGWALLIFLTLSPLLGINQDGTATQPQDLPLGFIGGNGEEVTATLPTSGNELVESEIIIDPDILALIQGKSLMNEIPLTLEFASGPKLEAAKQIIHQIAPALSIRQFSLISRLYCTIARELLQRIWPELNELPGLIGIFLERETIPQWMDAARQINLDPTVWNVQGYKGDPYSSVALIDHGFDPSQACFAGKNITWKDFNATNWPVANDTVGHGTKVGAIAVGNGWNYTDNQGRTIMSRVTSPYYSSGIEVGKVYYLVEYAVNVSRPGTLNLTGSWVANDASIEMKNFSICNSSGTIVATTVPTDLPNTNYTLEWAVDASSLGVYTVITKFRVLQIPISYNISLELRVPQLIGENGYNFQGVAPNSKLVALRATTTSESLDALTWILLNYAAFNITTLVMSFTLAQISSTFLELCNALVSAGIVVVAAGGNTGGATNYAGSGYVPGAADKTICVGAITQGNRLTTYSSRGGPSYVIYNPGLVNGFTIKPDVVAPGGEFPHNGSISHPLVVPDANTAEEVAPEKIINDTSEAIGTSFSAPAVAGVAQLLIEALGGAKNWSYTESQALAVKSVICMTATETNLPRINSTTNESQASPYSPSLDRGDKDVQEGYGRINPAAAIQAVTTSWNLEAPAPSGYLWGQNDGPMNATRSWATKVYLNQSYVYNFTLINPGSGDFDLYLYQTVPSTSGDPIIFRRSINAGVGNNEIISDFAVPASGNYYLVIKAVSGEGTWTLYANRTLDVVPPSYCWLNLPPFAPYLSKIVSFSITKTDEQTGIHYQELWRGNPGTGQLLATVVGNEVITWNTTSLPDGHYLVKARVFDGNNNSRDSENTLDLILDNSPPSYAQFVNLQQYGKYGGVVRIWIDSWDALSGVATCVVTDEVVGSIGTVPVVANPPYLFVWQTDESMDNTYQLSIVVQDRAGNQFQSAYLTIFIKNGELFMFGVYYFAIWIGPIIVIGYFLTRFILLHEGLTRVWGFFKKVRKATNARDWEGLTARLKKPLRSRQKRNN